MEDISAYRSRINKDTEAYVERCNKTLAALFKGDRESIRIYMLTMDKIKLPYFTENGTLIYESPFTLTMRFGVAIIRETLPLEKRQKALTELEDILSKKN